MPEGHSRFRYALPASVAAGHLAANLVPPPPGAPERVYGLDKAAHAVASAVLTGALAWARGPTTDRELAALVAIAAVYGVAAELTQAFVPRRRVEAGDALANVAGAALAGLVLRE